MKVIFYPCHPASFFFFSEAPALELSSPKRQVGSSQARLTLGQGGRTAPGAGPPVGGLLPPLTFLLPGSWEGRPMAQDKAVGREDRKKLPQSRAGFSREQSMEHPPEPESAPLGRRCTGGHMRHVGRGDEGLWYKHTTHWRGRVREWEVGRSEKKRTGDKMH